MLTSTASFSTLLSPRPPVRGRLGGCRLSKHRAQGPAQTSAGTRVAQAEQGETDLNGWRDLEAGCGGCRAGP